MHIRFYFLCIHSGMILYTFLQSTSVTLKLKMNIFAVVVCHSYVLCIMKKTR